MAEKSNAEAHTTALVPDTSERASITVPLDTLYPLIEVPNRLPKRGGRKLHHATVQRWKLTGLYGVRLQIVDVGCMACTCDLWVAEFLANVTAARKRAKEQAQPTATTDRAKRTAATLARHGLGGADR